MNYEGVHEGEVIRLNLSAGTGVIRGPFGMPDMPFRALMLRAGHTFDESLKERRVRFEVGKPRGYYEVTGMRDKLEAVNVEPL